MAKRVQFLVDISTLSLVPSLSSRVVYQKGQQYTLPDSEADNYIAQGKATLVKMSEEEQRAALSRLLQAVGVQAQTQPKLSLKPIISPETAKRIKNKQLSDEVKVFFSDKEVPVRAIASMLVNVLDYGIEIKDDALVAKVAGDILFLKRLTDYFYDNQPKG